MRKFYEFIYKRVPTSDGLASRSGSQDVRRVASKWPLAESNWEPIVKEAKVQGS